MTRSARRRISAWQRKGFPSCGVCRLLRSVLKEKACVMHTTPVRIHGKMISSDSVLSDLAIKTGVTKIIEFVSHEVIKPEPTKSGSGSSSDNSTTGQSNTIPKKTNKKVTITSSNVKDYFNVDVDCKSFEGSKVTMTYSISPKQAGYAKNVDSSPDIIIKLRFKVYDSETATIPVQTKDYTVILKKNESYKSSWDVPILLSSDKIATIYWNYSIESGTGTIGIEQ